MSTTSHVLVDTSALWDIKHPDFQKIVQISRDPERGLKIVAPHIVWEERRIQLLDKERERVVKLKDAYDAVVRAQTPDSMFRKMTLPPLHLWEAIQMDAESKEYMKNMAQKNNIEVIPLGPDHAERAWTRYFGVDAPFKRGEIPDNRRKDIPDSWIFETAIDLRTSHAGLVALCADGKLKQCFESIDIKVFKSSSDLVNFLERERRDADQPTVPATMESQAGEAHSDNPSLAVLMESFQGNLRDAEKKVLGIIGYLRGVPKSNFESILATLNINLAIGRNAAERLVLSGLIQDTGGTYLPRNRQACDLAATEVEPLMIKLVVQ